MAVSVDVVDLSGAVLCKACSEDSWTMRDVKVFVEEQTGISRFEQRLCVGLAELSDAARLADALPGGGELLLARASADWARWLQALQKDGLALSDAPSWVRRDRKLLLAAAQQTEQALVHADPEVLEDREFLLDAAEECAGVIDFVASSHLSHDRALVFQVLQLVRATAPAHAIASAEKLVDRYPELAADACMAPEESDVVGIGSVSAGVAAGAATGAAMATNVSLESVLALGGVAALENGAAAAGVTGACVGTGAVAAAVLGAVAVPLLGGFAVNQLVPGIPAANVDMRLAKTQGTCKVQVASVLWATEEGWGQVRLYYFASEALALSASEPWACARILYDCRGFLSRAAPLREVAWEGPAWPRSTIRKAAEQLNQFCRQPPESPDMFL